MRTEPFTDDELRNITSYYDAMDLLFDKGIIPVVYERQHESSGGGGIADQPQ